jgi:hypothetical protein
MKYRVGPNVSFVHAGRVYAEGDEIDEAAFKSEAALKSLIAAGKLINLTPAAGSGPSPTAGSGPAPAAGSGDAPAAGSGPAPAAGSGPAPAARSGPAPAAGSGDAASPDSEKGKDKK